MAKRTQEIKLVEVITVFDDIQARMLINALWEEKIPCVKRDVGNAGFLNLYGGNSTLGEIILVAEEYAEQAKTILQEMGYSC